MFFVFKMDIKHKSMFFLACYTGCQKYVPFDPSLLAQAQGMIRRLSDTFSVRAVFSISFSHIRFAAPRKSNDDHPLSVKRHIY